ncbi:ABC transporter substrate-binding protein [Clostridium sp. AM58-1XD]|uniref:ABC transporter substrate-binding protein n=1 Tax=Clostridium sp. AM58-1XD TaxID=2292307 RepID=UPI000E4DB599|nr:ABC transporter substrate-binding protein [Clostridium sp. AM58-1XD]RGY98753.1 carbohydrate ABC transporter substrate-binding protein [Clostridium sp. AM58-1XD]
MSRKGKIKLCTSLFVSVLVLAGCRNESSVVNYEESQEEVTEISFFGNKYEPENVMVIEEIISDFMVKNPDIRVSYESLKGSEYYEALEKRMAARKGDDVFMVNHDAVLALEATGQLADLSGLSTISGYTDQMLSQMENGGKIYWVPTTVSVFGLYCNMDLLKEHGQKAPENFQEWEDSCTYFKNLGITPIIANNDISLKTLAIGKGFYPLYRDNRQAEAFDRLNRGEDQLSQYLSPGFSMAEDLIDRGFIDGEKALHTKKTSDDLMEFTEGNAPFMLTGAWAAGRVENMQPGFEFQVVPYPILEDGNMLVINADTRLSINADSTHLEAAKRFVEYFTQADNIQKFADQQSSFSPLKGGSPSSVKEIQPLIPCYQSGSIVIGADGKLDLPIWELTAQVSEKLLSGETNESAMSWMDETIQERGLK